MWLLLDSVRESMRAAQNAGQLPSAEKQEAFALSRSHTVAESRLVQTAGGTAAIEISGVLTKSPNLFAMLFGGGNTSYPELIEALAQAQADPSVESIELHIDSPGGHVDGLYAAMEAVKGTPKPTTAVVDKATSAAYMLASQADRIIARNKGE